MNLQTKIGKRIKAARLEANLTQKNLAEKAGMLQNNLSDIEKGKENIKMDTVQRISDALGRKLRITFK